MAKLLEETLCGAFYTCQKIIRLEDHDWAFYQQFREAVQETCQKCEEKTAPKTTKQLISDHILQSLPSINQGAMTVEEMVEEIWPMIESNGR
jgi:hypothetical protein